MNKYLSPKNYLNFIFKNILNLFTPFIKRWEKNTDLKFDDVESINSQGKIRTGKQLGIPADNQFKPTVLTDEHKKNIKIWEKNTGKKYKNQNPSNQWKIRTGAVTGAGKSAGFDVSINAIRNAFVVNPDASLTELAKEIYGSDFEKASLAANLFAKKEISSIFFLEFKIS